MTSCTLNDTIGLAYSLVVVEISFESGGQDDWVLGAELTLKKPKSLLANTFCLNHDFEA
eukprot:m.55186 g.55186  ORF g.55186 m.55186 type:complete len:59 (-) comp48845_c0_seq1:537-713(-)